MCLGYWATVRVVQNPGDDISVAGYTSSELYDQYLDTLQGQYKYGMEFAPWGYDSVWAAALALNKTIEELNLNG